MVSVDTGYFETLGLAAVRGRPFTDADRDPVADVAVVNVRFAAMHGGGAGDRSAAGSRSRPPRPRAPGGAWRTVVGVTPSVRQGAPPTPNRWSICPWRWNRRPTPSCMVRARPGTPVAEIVRDELKALDGGLPIFGWQPLAWYSELSRWTQRTVGGIVGTLGVLALTLSALGIYAVTAYAAARRTKEAGIRLAVGATSHDVVRLFIRGAAWPAAAGVAIGLLGAVGLTRALQSLLPPTAGAGLVIGAAALVVAAVSCRSRRCGRRRKAASPAIAAGPAL